MIFNISEKDRKAFEFIRNKLIHFGKRPTLREINQVTGGKSPRSASIVIDRLVKLGLLQKVGDNLRLAENSLLNPASIETVNVPLIGSVACGLPILAVQNVEAYIPVSTKLAKKGELYFLLRAEGDSMNEAGIQNRDILLVRQQSTADDGQKVVALINDEATVKILERRGSAVILRPQSSNKIHKPTILTDNCQIQGVVIAVLPSDII
jgi:repressor LexA